MRYPWLLSMVFCVSCGFLETNSGIGRGPVHFEVISSGEPLELAQHVRVGKVTVFDFYADWCPPCKRLDKSLADLKRVHGDRLEVFKLDLVKWDSKLAQAQQIKDLPYLVVYDDQGRLFQRGASKNVLPQLLELLSKSATSSGR